MTNKSATMKQHTRRSFHLSETIEEELSPPAHENVPHLKRNTPILFSTNRGLHLRTTTPNTTLTPHTATSMTSNCTSTSLLNSTYNMTFCDLERWVGI